MKKSNILLVLFLILSGNVIYAQSIKFEKVVYADSSATKAVLFNRMNTRLIEFIGNELEYEKNIIQADQDLGIIKFKELIGYDPKGNRSDDGVINYTVNVFFKDGRFKIILDDIVHEGKGISLYEVTNDLEYPHEKRNFLKFRKKAWKELKEYVDLNMPKLFPSYENLILVPTEQEEDW
jgi:hypothetical protein